MKDEEIKIEEIEVSHTLGGYRIKDHVEEDISPIFVFYRSV
jgi:hypothetical protein